jgi:hypothetical protein
MEFFAVLKMFNTPPEKPEFILPVSGNIYSSVRILYMAFRRMILTETLLLQD